MVRIWQSGNLYQSVYMSVCIPYFKTITISKQHLSHLAMDHYYYTIHTIFRGIFTSINPSYFDVHHLNPPSPGEAFPCAFGGPRGDHVGAQGQAEAQEEDPAETRRGRRPFFFLGNPGDLLRA